MKHCFQKFTWDPKLDSRLPKIMDKLLTMTDEHRPYMLLISTGLVSIIITMCTIPCVAEDQELS